MSHRFRYSEWKKTLMINRNQLELGLKNATGSHGRKRFSDRRNRARWWFDRMHQIVDQARDWQPRELRRRNIVSPTTPEPTGKA